MRSIYGALVLGFLAGAVGTAAAESGAYTFQVPLAAVSPEGDFPIHLETATFSADGVISITLSPSGDLWAGVQFPGRRVSLTGTFAAAGVREALKMNVPTKGGAKFVCKLSGTKFIGTFVDTGTLTTGRGTFTIDVATAAPLTTAFDVSVRGGFGPTRRGAGTATIVDGVSEDVTAELTPGRTRQLRIHSNFTRWTGVGALTGSVLNVKSWKGRAFGATASGKALQVAYNAIPDVSLIVVNGDPLETAGGVPADLATDVAPFLSNMLSRRGLEVTTTSFADIDETTPGAGYSGIVSKLGALRDSFVVDRALPTSIVVVGYGHGAVRAHAAVRAVPDAPVAALIDLDATSCGWAAQGHDTAAIGGDPVGAFTIAAARYDVEDVVLDNVAAALEVVSWAKCPVALSGGAADIPFDDLQNRRPDGSVTGLFRLDTSTTHDELHDIFGTTVPKVAVWLSDLIAPPTKKR